MARGDWFPFDVIAATPVITGDAGTRSCTRHTRVQRHLRGVFVMVIARCDLIADSVFLVSRSDSILVIKQAAQTAMVAVFKFGGHVAWLIDFFVKWFAASAL